LKTLYGEAVDDSSSEERLMKGWTVSYPAGAGFLAVDIQHQLEIQQFFLNFSIPRAKII